jgi:transposase
MYSIDLRRSAVKLYHRLKSYRKAASALSVSVGALHTWVTKGIVNALMNEAPSASAVVAGCKLETDKVHAGNLLEAKVTCFPYSDIVMT